MTDHEATTRDALSDAYAIVEAFIDGEQVDPQALRSALDRADVRQHFVDLLVLREGVRIMAPAAWSAAGTVDRASRRVRWIAAAAALFVSLTAGYYAGQRVGVAPVEAHAIETAVGIEAPPAPPKPTQVIKLEPGVNWIDGRGGQ